MNVIKTFIIIIVPIFVAVMGYAETITLKTGELNECIEISTFLTNTKGEIFLYSARTSQIFKFKPNGQFEKSFCRNGIGPGEVKRVIRMFYNPENNALYLPEFYSSIPRISIFDSEGNFKNYLDIEVSPTQKDHINKLIFLADGSFYAVMDERIGWEAHGDIYLTRDKFSLLYFDKAGKLKAKIFEALQNDEIANAPKWGGPGILFSPSLITRITREGNICLWKSDENSLKVYDKTGAVLATTTLEMSRMLLSKDEFEAAKKDSIKNFENDLRMQALAKKMIKLKYKPIYNSYFLADDHFIFLEFKKENSTGYTKETVLTIFDKDGKCQSRKTVKGLVMNIVNDKLYIKDYDADDNEIFRIEAFK